MKIYAHTLVKNEERYVWFSVMSVINYVDHILLWDTQSTDNTYKILEHIKKLFPEKVSLKQAGRVDPEMFTTIRQQMLDETKADWVIIVDGDEVWWDDSIKKLTEVIKDEPDLDSVVTHYYNLIGDIYHYQEELAGMYEIDGIKGHLTIRAMNNKIPGLHLQKPHGTQGFFDTNGVLVQDRSKDNRFHISDPGYLHFTNLVRSVNRESDLKVIKRKHKHKYELGKQFPLDFYYPEVFFRSYPEIVPTPWIKIDNNYTQKAIVQTPLRKIKRRLLKSNVGY